MPYVVRMPKLGVEMETGIVIEWYLDVGETAEEGDVIAEIESEKSTAEVAAREDGALRERYLDAGEEGPPGAAMG
ncbi:lipoyl domain-containing protein, partial [Halolamina salina]